MQDPYPATFQRRHHNVTPVPPFYTRNNNLSKWKLLNNATSFTAGSAASDGSPLFIRSNKSDGSFYQATFSDERLVLWNVDKSGKYTRMWNGVTKDDLALVTLLLSGTSEVSSSNLYATMKGKREIQVSGWFRTSSTKPTGTKIFSIPSGYTIGINITLLAMESVSGAIISLWGDQRGTTFTTQREIPAGQYYVIPIPIQLQSA